MPGAAALTTEQRVRVDINPVTEAGNPAAIDGELDVQVIEGEENVTIEDIPGENAFFIVAAAEGTATVQVQADADLDEDEVRTIGDIIAVAVASPEAAALGMVIGDPELNPNL